MRRENGQRKRNNKRRRRNENDRHKKRKGQDMNNKTRCFRCESMSKVSFLTSLERYSFCHVKGIREEGSMNDSQRDKDIKEEKKKECPEKIEGNKPIKIPKETIRSSSKNEQYNQGK
jgi:hypothetical protein